jgi:Xaa-Pro aminopeptidase
MLIHDEQHIISHHIVHSVVLMLLTYEGPQGISSTMKNPTVMNTTLAPGMIVSNEPGYYESGSFGIRIESLVLVKEVPTARQVGGKPYLGFETITMVPIQQKMIDISMLTDDEIQWLNNYHADVREKIEKLVDDDTRKWLIENTQPIRK